MISEDMVLFSVSFNLLGQLIGCVLGRGLREGVLYYATPGPEHMMLTKMQSVSYANLLTSNE
jgi:hypothetical protein